MSDDSDSLMSLSESLEDLSAAQTASLSQPAVVVELPIEFGKRDTKTGAEESSVARSNNSSYEYSYMSDVVRDQEGGEMEPQASLHSLPRWENPSKQTTKLNDVGDWDNISGVSSSWSLLGASNAGSVAASSTISGFDLISLNGSSKKACKLCSFLNDRNASICLGCNMALVPNPCMDCDKEVAHHLQNKVEEYARAQQRQLNLKRASLASASLFVRSQCLVDDIESVHRSAMDFSRQGGICSLPLPALRLLTSRFLDAIRSPTDPNELPFTLCYCFTQVNNVNTIFRDGFGSMSFFGSTPEVASWVYRARNKNATLGTISEDYEEENSNTISQIVPKNATGWIVAIVKDVSVRTTRFFTGTPGQKAHLYQYQCHSTSQALPLAYSLDASVLYDDIARRLVDKLTGALQEFCLDAYSGDRARGACQAGNGDYCFETADEYALESKLQAMLYEDAMLAHRKEPGHA